MRFCWKLNNLLAIAIYSCGKLIEWKEPQRRSCLSRPLNEICYGPSARWSSRVTLFIRCPSVAACEQSMHRMVIYPSVYSGLEKLEKGKYISTRLGEVLPGRTMKNPATIVALEPAGRELLTHISPEIEPVPRISLAGRGRALLRIVTHGRFGREKNTPIPDNSGKSD
jgi:hypothetical protein